METTEVIIPETEPEIIIEEVATPPEAFISDSPQDGIEDLKRQLAESQEATRLANAERDRANAVAAEESRRRANSDQLAQQNYGAATNANAEARELEYQNIVNTRSGVQAHLTNLTEQFVKANTDGDFTKAGQLQIEIGKYSAKLERLEDGQAQIEEQRKNAAARSAPVQRQQEPNDQFVNRPWSPQEYEKVMADYTPTTAAWLRANPRYATDVAFRRQVISAHGLLVAKNVPPDSDAYFRGVEELVGVRNAEPTIEQARDAASASRVNKENAVSTANKPTQSRTSPAAAAPPSRNVPDGNNPAGGNSNRVQLTAEQRKMANLMFPKSKPSDPDPEVVYAKHWRELQKEGRLFNNGVVL